MEPQPTVHPDITFERLERAILSSDELGFCINYGSETDGVEPDAEQYRCSDCSTNGVYGADQLILLELFH